MKNTCLGFPISKGRINHRVAKSQFRAFYVAGLNHFKVADYEKYGYKVGDLVHDCDGFNWRIARIVPEYTTLSNIRGEVLCDFSFYKEDGTSFCHVSPPRTRQEIVGWYKMLSANRETDPWKFTERYEELYGKNFSIAEDGTVVRSK